MIELVLEPADVPRGVASTVTLVVRNVGERPCRRVRVLRGVAPVTCTGRTDIRVPRLAPREEHREALRVSPTAEGTVALPVILVEHVDERGVPVRHGPAELTLGVRPAPAPAAAARRRRTTFISYRHADCHRVVEHLAPRLRQAGLEVFDDSCLRPGDLWAQALLLEASRAAVLLAVIDRRWLVRVTELQGRAHEPNAPVDWVRIEIATALEKGIPVIAVLVDGADPPPQHVIPGDLRGLTERQVVRWSAGAPIDELLDAVDRFTR